MGTVRLTMAQALVRFLCAQSDRGRWRRGAALRRRVGDLRPRQRGGARRGAPRGPGPAPDLPGPQRAGHGPRGHRVREGARAAAHDGVHDVDRPRRDEHGHRGRGRPRQSPAGAAPPRRRLRQPHSGSGPPAGRGLRRPDDLRQRLLPARLAVLGPDHAPRAASPEPPRRHRRPHGPGRLRPGDAGAAPGRAGRGVRLSPSTSSSRACTGSSGPGPIPPSSRPWPSGFGGRERPLLVAGGGVHYSLAEPALRAFAERHGIPVAETQAGKGSLPWDHAGLRRRDRRVRLDRRQRAGRRRRPRPRRRDPPGRLPHGLPRPVPGAGPHPGGAERRPARRRQARRPAPGGRRRAGVSRSCRRRSAPGGRPPPGWRRRAGSRRSGRGWSTPPPPAARTSPRPRGRSSAR